MDRAMNEIALWKELGNHDYIVRYIDSEIVDGQVLILMELCEGGFTLINMLTYCNNKIPQHVVLSMMRDIS